MGLKLSCICKANIVSVSIGNQGIQWQFWGAMAPGPVLLVAEKGPHAWEKIQTKSQKNV